jgi:hypothetical protein
MARRNNPKSYKTRIAIVGDGFTEKIYFEQMRETERIKDVVIKPELPRKSVKGGSYKKSIESAKDLINEGYDHVYCLVDYDTVIKENKALEFLQDIGKLNADDITVYINNPCFETWVLAHYERTGQLFDDCESVEKRVKKYLDDYCKNQEYLKKKNIYGCLRPMLESTAIPNAEFLEIDRDIQGPKYPRAEVYKLMRKILKIE